MNYSWILGLLFYTIAPCKAADHLPIQEKNHLIASDILHSGSDNIVIRKIVEEFNGNVNDQMVICCINKAFHKITAPYLLSSKAWNCEKKLLEIIVSSPVNHLSQLPLCPDNEFITVLTDWVNEASSILEIRNNDFAFYRLYQICSGHRLSIPNFYCIFRNPFHSFSKDTIEKTCIEKKAFVMNSKLLLEKYRKLQFMKDFSKNFQKYQMEKIKNFYFMGTTMVNEQFFQDIVNHIKGVCSTERQNFRLTSSLSKLIAEANKIKKDIGPYFSEIKKNWEEVEKEWPYEALQTLEQGRNVYQFAQKNCQQRRIPDIFNTYEKYAKIIFQINALIKKSSSYSVNSYTTQI